MLANAGDTDLNSLGGDSVTVRFRSRAPNKSAWHEMYSLDAASWILQSGQQCISLHAPSSGAYQIVEEYQLALVPQLTSTLPGQGALLDIRSSDENSIDSACILVQPIQRQY